jgi:hypothetical protein
MSVLPARLHVGKRVKLLLGTRDPEGFWSTYRHPRRCPAVVEPLRCDAGDAASVAAAVAASAPSRVFVCLPQALRRERCCHYVSPRSVL